MIGDHINGHVGTLQVVLPHPESIKNGKGVIVLFGRGESMGVESNEIDITRVRNDGEDSTKCIVGSICLNNQGLIRLPVCKDWSRGEGGLQSIEGLPCIVCKIPLSPLTGQVS